MDQIRLMIPFFDKTMDWLVEENALAIHLDVTKVFDIILGGKLLVNLGGTY